MEKKFFKSIVFRIWFPFAFSIAIVVGLALWWYPQQQEMLFTQNSRAQWNSIANNIALGVEMSFKHEDFSGIQKSIEMATNTADLEFVAITQTDESGQEEVFVSNPLNYNEQKILKPDEEKLNVLRFPIDVEGFKGTVILANTYDSIETRLFKLNLPVIIFFIALLVFGLSVFYLLANSIAKPIRKVTYLATELEKQNYDLPIVFQEGETEIADLNNSLLNLQESLRIAEARNKEFNIQLENQIIKRTEDLHARTEELVQAQKFAAMCSFQIELHSEKMRSSGTFNDVFNMRPEQVPHLKSFLQLIHPEDRGEFLDRFQDIQAKAKGSIEMDLRLIPGQADLARWFMIQGNIQKDNEGKLIFKGIIQDINTRKVNEEVLDRLSLVAKKTTNCVVITDINKRIVWVNDSLIRLSGYTREEIIGNTPRMFQFEKTDIKTAIYIKEQLDKHHQVQAEILNRGKYGNEYWLKLDILPLRKEDGSITGYMAVEIDITEAKKKEEEIKHLLGITQSQNSRLLDFAHIVSHNLRSHSANFDMLIQLLATKIEGISEDNVFGLLNKASNNLAETINHLREIVAINDNLEKGMVEVNLQETIEKVLVNTIALASEEGVTIVNELHEPLVVEAIPAYTDSIILNLITNAIKYKSNERPPQIRVYSKRDDTFTSIFVEDNGLGIDLELHRSKLFGMYKRFHRHKDARGLGLFITKNHIEMMGGTIEVQSEVNVGSTFIAKFRNEKIQYHLAN